MFIKSHLLQQQHAQKVLVIFTIMYDFNTFDFDRRNSTCFCEMLLGALGGSYKSGVEVYPVAMATEAVVGTPHDLK